MGDLNVSVNNVGMNSSTKTFEANSALLENKALGMINFSSDNDYSVPLQFGEEGLTVCFRPDQIDAIKLSLSSASKNEVMGELFGGGGPSLRPQFRFKAIVCQPAKCRINSPRKLASQPGLNSF